MKKYIIFITLFLFIPFGSMAALNYSRQPTGNNITTPVIINFSFNNAITDLGWTGNENYWNLLISTDFASEYIETPCYPISENSISHQFNLPIGYFIKHITISGFNTDNNCSYNGDDIQYFLINCPDINCDLAFNIISGSYITIPVASSSDLFASVGTLATDLWVLLAVAMGVPLGFYVIPKIIALFI